MVFDDDDDLLPSSSSQEAFTRADKGKMQKLKQEITERMGAEHAAELDRAEVRSHADLQKLQSDLSGEADEETKRQQQQDKQVAMRSPKTKTHREQEEAIVETAQDQPNADTLIERQEDAPEVSDEETQSEPG